MSSVYVLQRKNANGTGYQNWYWDRDEAMTAFDVQAADYPAAIVEVYELDVEHLITSRITEAIEGENDEVNAERIAIHDGAAPVPVDENASQARTTLWVMYTREVTAHDNRSYRIAKEREEYKKDPAPDTLAILSKLEREQEACKLRIAALKLAVDRLS